MTRPDDRQWEFGSFRLDATEHLLFRDGKLVPLSRKAADILLVLVERHGQLVEKEQLMRRIWPDSFVEESNLAVHISQLRKTLSDEDAGHRIETIPRRGYRFVGEVNLGSEARERTAVRSNPVAPDVAEDAGAKDTTSSPAAPGASASREPAARGRKRLVWVVGCAAAVLVAGATLVGLRLGEREKPGSATPDVVASIQPVTKDTVMLAEIANNTGDPVFNTTLRQAMAIELEQSPYLSLVPESRIEASLRLMGQPSDAPLTPDLSQELCLRDGSMAVLDGWIAKMGTQYVLGLRAINCRTGDHIADLQTTAAGKEQVLKALGDVTGELRTRLGESLSTVQKFDTPIEEATTPSLEALQAYSIGRATMIQRGESASCVPFFQRAIRLDPDFAIAYAALGNAYANLGETGLAATNIRRAYELSGHVSEHEKLYIESHYHQFVTGDLEKATQVYETWAATYPNDEAPRTNLAVIYSDLGIFDRSLVQAKEAVRIAPDDGQNIANLMDAYLCENNPEEARATAEQAIAKNLDSSVLRLFLYDADFLEANAAGMQKQLDWAAGEPGVEDAFWDHQADTFAYTGHLAEARESFDRAVDAAKRADEKETAAGYELEAAQEEALSGNATEARRRADEALSLAGDRDTEYGAAVALAFSGAAERAQSIADRLDKEFPDDTFVQILYLPTIRGIIAVQQKDPARALKALDAARPYELGLAGGLLPPYVRGLAYLEAGDGKRAEAEFEKVIDHPGVVLNSSIGALAHLEVGHSQLLQRQPAQAKASYDDFLAGWKNADSDNPILLEAKAEYAKQWQHSER